MGKVWETMPAEDFIAMASNPHFLGNQRIKTQHFIGASRWVQISDTEMMSYNQMRVAHQKYRDDDLKEVLYKGHAHGKATVYFRKVEGAWKFAGLVPDIRWSEGDYDKIFHEE